MKIEKIKSVKIKKGEYLLLMTKELLNKDDVAKLRNHVNKLFGKDSGRVILFDGSFDIKKIKFID